MRTTFTIELRMDIGPDDQMTAMKEVLTAAAKQVYAQSVMIAGKRQPIIAVTAENAFIGTEQIEAFTGDPDV